MQLRVENQTSTGTLNMKKSLFLFVLLVCSLPMWQGCVSTYQRLSFYNTSSVTAWNAIDQEEIHMAIYYEVLSGKGMKQYARMERKSNVNLVMLTVHNSGQREFVISRDAVFFDQGGDTIIPLSLEEAAHALIKPVMDEPKKESVVEVDAPGFIDFLLGAGKATNTVKKVVSHVRFSEDMVEHYIADQILAPGSVTSGLLVLPVTRGTEVKASICR